MEWTVHAFKILIRKAEE